MENHVLFILNKFMTSSFYPAGSTFVVPYLPVGGAELQNKNIRSRDRD